MPFLLLPSGSNFREAPGFSQWEHHSLDAHRTGWTGIREGKCSLSQLEIKTFCCTRCSKYLHWENHSALVPSLRRQISLINPQGFNTCLWLPGVQNRHSVLPVQYNIGCPVVYRTLQAYTKGTALDNWLHFIFLFTRKTTLFTTLWIVPNPTKQQDGLFVLAYSLC